MSIRYYRPRRRSRRSITPLQNAALISSLFAVIALHITYPLVSGEALRIITIATVYVAALSMSLHALYSYGWKFAYRFVLTTFFYALIIEIIGTSTAWPFGQYSYSPTLGAQLWGVPLVVPCAWMMMAYPSLMMARRLTRHWVFLVGGYSLMAWDLFLDPQMVSAGRWSWSFTGSHVPFQPEIPLSNAFGWMLTGMGLMALLHLLLPRERRAQGPSRAVPEIFLLWTLIGGVIANLFYFDRPGIAFFAGIAMAIVVIPYFIAVQLGRND